MNDVWASLDGGYTWGQCANHGRYNNREDQVSVFDAQGRLLIMSGAQTYPEWGLAQDVWRSTISFNDIDAVSRACHIPVPACGVGLKCLPQGYCSCDSKGAGVVMQYVADGPWKTARNEAGLALRRTPLTFFDPVARVTKTFPTSLIFYGGKQGSTYYNDVSYQSKRNKSVIQLIHSSAVHVVKHYII